MRRATSWWSGKVSQDGSGYEVYAQRFSSAGTKQGGEFLVNTFTTFHQKQAAVARDADGDFVVVWTSDGDPVSRNTFGIVGQRYNAAGVAQGGRFAVNKTLAVYGFPAIAMDAAGNFAVAWESHDDDGSGRSISTQTVQRGGADAGERDQSRQQHHAR